MCWRRFWIRNKDLIILVTFCLALLAGAWLLPIGWQEKLLISALIAVTTVANVVAIVLLDRKRERECAIWEEQRRSFVYGNCKMSNPAITRELVDEVDESMKEKP